MSEMHGKLKIYDKCYLCRKCDICEKCEVGRSVVFVRCVTKCEKVRGVRSVRILGAVHIIWCSTLPQCTTEICGAALCSKQLQLWCAQLGLYWGKVDVREKRLWNKLGFCLMQTQQKRSKFEMAYAATWHMRHQILHWTVRNACNMPTW